jgi:hypothetical protein
MGHIKVAIIPNGILATGEEELCRCKKSATDVVASLLKFPSIRRTSRMMPPPY